MSKINLNDMCLGDTSEFIKESKLKIEQNSEVVENLVKDIISNCCSELDNYVAYVKSIIAEDSSSVPTELLEDMTLALPTLLYQVGDMSELIGVKEDIAKAVKQELYNTIMETGEGKSTDKKIRAELETQSESLALVIYQRAYKSIKLKTDFGLELLQSVKKILSKRISELELSKNTRS